MVSAATTPARHSSARGLDRAQLASRRGQREDTLGAQPRSAPFSARSATARLRTPQWSTGGRAQRMVRGYCGDRRQLREVPEQAVLSHKEAAGTRSNVEGDVGGVRRWRRQLVAARCSPLQLGLSQRRSSPPRSCLRALKRCPLHVQMLIEGGFCGASTRAAWALIRRGFPSEKHFFRWERIRLGWSSPSGVRRSSAP